MILRKIRIASFLSVADSIEFDIDKNVTVLLGANDHGKSNILKALCCLNEDTAIGKDDVNWDAAGAPRLEFDLKLSNADVERIWAAIHEVRKRSDERNDNAIAQAAATANQELDQLDVVALGVKLAALTSSLSGALVLSLTRTNAGTPLRLFGTPLDAWPGELSEAIRQGMPRVELFPSSNTELQDSVKAEQIKTDDFEFLQGVFYYAGLDPLNSEKLFSQNDKTERALDEASKSLDSELRQLWAQGRDLDLHFELRHRGTAIEFQANDPAVKNRKARMSKRSAGVTQFFRLSMILHARRKKHPANSYIYLFDEPGVFLHPKGQKDLLQVFEQLSIEAQILYATHSLFMLNQNFPERHRLIGRGTSGTIVDQKPYRANWRLATDALGVNLTSSILFSPAILLVEGDSDPLYIYELFRQMNVSGNLDADANMLGVISYSDIPNLRFLLQAFKAENQDCKVMVLSDGDKEGKKHVVATRQLCERLKVRHHILNLEDSIEDYVLFEDTFLAAAVEAINMAHDAEGKARPLELLAQVTQRWADHKNAPKVTAGKWFKIISREVLGSEVSKVSLARNYAFMCREDSTRTLDEVRKGKASGLLAEIQKELKLPSLRAERQLIQTAS